MARRGPDDDFRPLSPLEYEERFWGRGLSRVAGVDEVGRGPLAGPVVAAAVVLPRGCHVDGADDSKRLTGVQRVRFAGEIRASAVAIGIGAGSVREIDTLGIAQATALAMHRALSALHEPPEHVVIDGRPVTRLPWIHDSVVGGDGAVHSIACASIVAKVLRDALMARLSTRYPAYGWARNAGYGTPAHIEALREFGPSPHHRRTFGGVRPRLEI